MVGLRVEVGEGRIGMGVGGGAGVMVLVGAEVTARLVCFGSGVLVTEVGYILEQAARLT